MVEIKNLTKYYGQKAAVKNISFTVEDHEILGFLGPNGAGKSTTMNIICGVIPSSSGTVTINGFDIAKDPIKAKRHIGFLPEIPPVYPDMKVKEYLTFVAGLKGVPGVKRKAQVAKAMDRLRITDVAGRLIRNLSKGYRQRVGFAQALLGEPDVLILDEPTVGLDPEQVIEVRNLILELKQDHTIILSSHVLSEISAVCDRVVIISKGEIRAVDTIDHLEERADTNPILHLKVKGGSQEVAATMRQVDGVRNVSNISRFKTGIYTYDVELQSSDIRNSLLAALLVKKFDVLEVQEQKNLEQVFVDAGQPVVQFGTAFFHAGTFKGIGRQTTPNKNPRTSENDSQPSSAYGSNKEVHPIMFSLYKKELQSYFLSPAAYAVLAFFTLTFSLTMIMDISAASSLYEFSFTSLFYTNLFYLAILFPVLTMRSFSEERKNGTEVLLLSTARLVLLKIVLWRSSWQLLPSVLIMLAVSLFYPIVTALNGHVSSGKFNLYLCGILSVWSGLHCTGHSDFFFHRIHHSFHHHERSCYHHFAADGQHWYLFLFL